MAIPIRTTTFTEPKTLSEVLKSEFGTISREVVTIKSGEGVLEIGTVLAKLTSGGDAGKYVAAVHDTEATDGSNIGAAVLLDKCDATSADASNVVVCARLAEVSALGLVWDSSVDNATKKNLKIADLATHNIIVRRTN